MKTVKYIYCVIAAAVLAVSCENAKFLNREPYSQTSPENFYKTESDMRMALTSCYEIINAWKIPGMSNTQRGTYAQGLLFIMNGPSDEVTAVPSSPNQGTELFLGNFVESHQGIREFWKCYYVGINRCNIILAYIDGIDIPEAQKTRFKAEARFMRAFFYYHLAWNFGGVPIVEDYASTGDEPRSSLEKVYEFILADLKFASENITTTGLIQGVSATSHTANAYIGRICNYLAACKRYETGAELALKQPLNDFSWVDEDAMTDMAKTALESVVTTSPYILIEDYTNLFRETTKAAQQQECLLLAELPLSGVEGYWPNSYYLPAPSSNGALVPTVYGGYYTPTTEAFYTYHHKDPRRDHNMTGRMSDGTPTTYMVDGYTYADPDPIVDTISVTVKTPAGATVYEDRNRVELLQKEGTDADGYKVYTDMNGNDMYKVKSGEPYIYIGGGSAEEKDKGYVIPKRYYFPNPLFNSPTQSYRPTSGMSTCPGKFRFVTVGSLQHTHQQHAVSLPLMRLADVYLMYAEALYFDGDEGTARQYLDKVLMRAAKNDQALFDELKAAYARTDFVEELLESRQRELVFEFSRKFDLIRFNRIDAAIAALDNERLTRFDGEDIIIRTFRKQADENGALHVVRDENGAIIYEEQILQDEEARDALLKFPATGQMYVGINALQENWESHKIWLPISEEQIGVNQKLVQNAGWGGNTGVGSIPETPEGE